MVFQVIFTKGKSDHVISRSKPSTDSGIKSEIYFSSGAIWGHCLISLRSLDAGTPDIWGLLVECTMRSTAPTVSLEATYSRCFSSYKIKRENRLSDTMRKPADATTVPRRLFIGQWESWYAPQHSDSLRHHAEWKKPDTWEHAVWFHLYEVLGQPRTIYSDENENYGCLRCG